VIAAAAASWPAPKLPDTIATRAGDASADLWAEPWGELMWCRPLRAREATYPVPVSLEHGAANLTAT